MVCGVVGGWGDRGRWWVKWWISGARGVVGVWSRWGARGRWWVEWMGSGGGVVSRVVGGVDGEWRKGRKKKEDKRYEMGAQAGVI